MNEYGGKGGVDHSNRILAQRDDTKVAILTSQLVGHNCTIGPGQEASAMCLHQNGDTIVIKLTLAALLSTVALDQWTRSRQCSVEMNVGTWKHCFLSEVRASTNSPSMFSEAAQWKVSGELADYPALYHQIQIS